MIACPPARPEASAQRSAISGPIFFAGEKVEDGTVVPDVEGPARSPRGDVGADPAGLLGAASEARLRLRERLR